MNLYSNEHFLSVIADFYKHNVKDMQAVANAQLKIFEHILPRPGTATQLPLLCLHNLKFSL